jgi:hypothetical protein
VRLVLASGEVVEFAEPVWASTVMKKYPQHVILHCYTPKCGEVGRRKVTVLRPEQHLKRKENYLVTPFRANGNSREFLDSWAFFALSTFNKKFQSKRRQKSRKWWFYTLFDKIFRSSRSSPSSKDDSTKPLLGFYQEEDSTATFVEHRKSRDHHLHAYLSLLPTQLIPVVALPTLVILVFCNQSFYILNFSGITALSPGLCRIIIRSLKLFILSCMCTIQSALSILPCHG